MSEATTHYNCHSYAWYRSEGGTKNVWIGLYTQTAEDVYWTDDSYFEVCSLNDATKISYVGNHSAIKISGTLCRSKWGPWGLIEHAVDYGPSIYQMTSNRTYYLKTPSIQGTNILCSNYTYSVSIPASCSVTWTSSSNISINSSTGYASRIGSTNGEGWIEADISSGCGSVTVRKEIWVGKPNYLALGGAVDGFSAGQEELSNCEYTYAEAEYNNPPYTSAITGYSGFSGIDAFEWDIPYSSDWNIEEEYGGRADWEYVEIDYYDEYPPSQEAIHIRAHNTCSWSLWKEIWWDVDDCAGGYYAFTLSPNPVEEVLTVSFDINEEGVNDENIQLTQTEKTNTSGVPVEVSIFDKNKSQILYRKGNTDNNMELDVSTIPAGSYFIHVSIEGEKTQKKHLIIN